MHFYRHVAEHASIHPMLCISSATLHIEGLYTEQLVPHRKADRVTLHCVVQVLKGLTASETAYSAVPSKPISDSNPLAGTETTLVALVQVCYACASLLVLL